MLLYAKLRDLREDSDKTQAEVGAAIGLPQRTYSYYETGQRTIPLSVLTALADYYQTSTDYLLGRTDQRNPYPPAKK